MRSPDDNDPLLRALASLPPHLPGDAVDRQVRARCHARLARPPREAPALLEPGAVGAVCAMYAWQIVRVVIR